MMILAKPYLLWVCHSLYFIVKWNLRAKLFRVRMLHVLRFLINLVKWFNLADLLVIVTDL